VFLRCSYKDCPSLDLDKLLEDVQNGLHAITAYHLLFPTRSTLNLLTKSPVSDKTQSVSSSVASFLPSALTNADTDLTTSMQSLADPSTLHLINTNDSHSTATLTNGMKSRTGAAAYERVPSATDDPEHHTNDSSTTITGHTNSSSATTATNEEKENRRIIDIQCKIKTKETRSCLVKRNRRFRFDLMTVVSLCSNV
jgi:hypothetical protein